MKKVIVVSCLLLVVSLLVGCGERTETSRYYYSPSWTNDGRIIFIGGTKSVDKDILGSQLSSSYSEYVKTIYPSGTQESQALFGVTEDPAYAMSCSPNRAYVAYLSELRSGEYGKIIIRSITTEAFTGMKVTELTFYPRIKSFDWSSNGDQIVYCTSSEVKIRDWNDFNGSTEQVVTSGETNLNFVSWKDGNQIAFVSTLEGTFMINSNGTGRKELVGVGVVVDKPQVSSAAANPVYGIMGSTYVEVTVSTGATSEVASSFSGVLPRISPDGDMVTYSKSGEDSGVYIMYTATGTEETVKQ
jgi:WD40 repeat protein